MAKSLAEIREKLLATEKEKENFSGGRDNVLYQFWNIEKNQTAIVRYLPDNTEENDFFWLERQMIKIPFSGIEGEPRSGNIITVQVPCVEMWKMECPIHKEIRPWFKDPSLEDLARKYWKKRSYIFQGLVVSSPFVEDNLPENPVRRFIINPKLFNIIKEALMDPDFGDVLPTHYDEGFDFKIKKTQAGQYADYTTSEWSRHSRSLSQEERDAVTEHGLFNLVDFMPKKPSADEMNAIGEMFEASVNGDLYDPSRWGKFYRPFGLDDKSTKQAENKSDKSDKVSAEVETPSVETAPSRSADDIMAVIKARKQAQAAK